VNTLRNLSCTLVVLTACDGSEPSSAPPAPVRTTHDAGTTSHDSGTRSDAGFVDAGHMRAAPTFPDVVGIINGTCNAYCHPGGYAPMSLSAQEAYDNLVNAQASGCPPGRMRVAPSDPAGSELMAKLTGGGMCGGSAMPPGGATIPSEHIDLIRRWIEAGAPR